MDKKYKVYVGIPTVGSIVDSQSYVLREMQELYKDHIEFVYPDQCIRRIFHDFARNAIVDDFLSTDCDILWFLDSDVTPNKFALDLIAIHGAKWQISGCTYPVFMIPPGSDEYEVIFTCYEKNSVTGGYKSREVPFEGESFVDGLATGCLFIKREVFTKLSKPYFEFKFNATSKGLEEGEDLGFVRKVNEAGYKFYTDFSFVCKHQKTVDLLDINNYAINYANRAILAYDEKVKSMINGACSVSYNKGVRDMADAFKKSDKVKLNNSDIISPAKTLWVPN